jgi:hypothetical protein
VTIITSFNTVRPRAQQLEADLGSQLQDSGQATRERTPTLPSPTTPILEMILSFNARPQ